MPSAAPADRWHGAVDSLPAALLLRPTARLRAIDKHLDEYLERAAVPRVYIMTDKPLYKPGETVRYRVDLRQSATLLPLPGGWLRVSLRNPRGAAVGTGRVRIHDGVAAGTFPLAKAAPGGPYRLELVVPDGSKDTRLIHVSAYRQPRLKKSLEFVRKAYGPGDRVRATVKLSRDTGGAFANKKIIAVCTVDDHEVSRKSVTTDRDGGAIVSCDLPRHIARGDALLTVLARDGGVTESIQRRVPVVLGALNFAMYPEGGDLVVGLPSRVYFAAETKLGDVADVQGRVVDDRGREVVTFRSLRDGLGRFELQPQRGRSYRVEITKPTGIRSMFAVPTPAKDGCVMRSLDRPDAASRVMRFAAWCSKPQQLIVRAVLRDSRIGSAEFSLPGHAGRIVSLPVSRRTQGAVRLTLFDRKRDPVAERLVYRGKHRDVRVAITADHRTYSPGDQVTLTVRTTHDGQPVPASLGLSVVDDTVLSFAADKTSKLLAHVYLDPEIGFAELPDANFYFSDSPDASAALDLVLGTKGWRRFEWNHAMASVPALPLVEPASPGAGNGQLFGRVVDTKTGSPLIGATVVVSAPGVTGTRAAITNPTGDFVVPRLPPGTYVIAVYYADMHMRRRGVNVYLGKNTPVFLRLDTANAAGEVIAIRGAPPTIDRTPTRQGAADYARNIPVPGRTYAQALAATRNREQRVVSFSGSTSLENRYVVDGVNTTGLSFGSKTRRRRVRVRERRRTRGREAGSARSDFRDTAHWAPDVRTGVDGSATVSFRLPDSVTSFRATAEGFSSTERAGHGELVFASVTPLSVRAALPTEVSSGDTMRLPVTVTNRTRKRLRAVLTITLDAAFRLQPGAKTRRMLTIAPGRKQTVFVPVDVVGKSGGGGVRFAVSGARLTDQVRQHIKIVPLGFPVVTSRSGTLVDRNTIAVDLSESLAGTLEATLKLYPSPLASMTSGTEAILREPSGCFEQTSSANYPNVMAMQYLEQHKAASPAVLARAAKMIGRGYKKLVAFETSTKGYEWFGKAPGHEALSAYGLMQFEDMKRVYGGVDDAMMARTARWLMSRRDGNGGYKRSKAHFDSFGGAGAVTSNAYVTWALTEAGRGAKLGRELTALRKLGLSSDDPYHVALAANGLLNVHRTHSDTTRIAGRLATMQDVSGTFPGAAETITRSGGRSLLVETTSLALMALIKASRNGSYSHKIRLGIAWLRTQRSGSGAFGSTQGTVLALKALSAYARYGRKIRAAGVASVFVNGKRVGRIAFAKGHTETLSLPNLGTSLKSGHNKIELRLQGTGPLPYSIEIKHRSKKPRSSRRVKLRIDTTLLTSHVGLGESAKLRVRVANTTASDVPMTLARVGIPGGMTTQRWQLEELRKSGSIGFYETRARELVLYLRALKPGQVKTVDLSLMARTPGKYTAPASNAYLYYTAEHKAWARPVVIQIDDTPRNP